MDECGVERKSGGEKSEEERKMERKGGERGGEMLNSYVEEVSLGHSRQPVYLLFRSPDPSLVCVHGRARMEAGRNGEWCDCVNLPGGGGPAGGFWCLWIVVVEDPGAGECGTGAWSVRALWLLGHSTGRGQSLMKEK